VNGAYCKQQMTDKRRHWTPLDVQPAPSDVVTVGKYYATLKGHPEYKKHVTWLVHSPHLAVYEYQGMPPVTNNPHANARHQNGEFVRTKPDVLDNVRQGLKRKNAQPREVYEDLVVANQSDTRPRDHKQVRNQAQVTTRPTAVGPGSNVADEFVALLAALHRHPFVKLVTVRHEQHPVVVAYTEDQMKDISRFCSVNTPAALKTVLGIDRTFNLGSCYVTVCVYRNMAVVRKTTQDHPIFLGPVMFHYDGRLDTYKTFLRACADAFAGDLTVAEFNGDVEMLFGSDEEKALVRAVRDVFPQASHIFCTRHVEENCRRYMTDVAGVPVKHREAVLECLRAVSSMR